MFEKNLNMGLLLDFYGEVLPQHTKTVMDLYYNEDLSLAEIAENVGISRQGVRHSIKKGEEDLLSLEEKLGLCKQAQEMIPLAEKLLSLAENESGALAETAQECARLLLDRK